MKMRDIGSEVQNILQKYETDEQVKKYNQMLEQMKKVGLIEKPLTPIRDNRIIFPNIKPNQANIFSRNKSMNIF